MPVAKRRTCETTDGWSGKVLERAEKARRAARARDGWRRWQSRRRRGIDGDVDRLTFGSRATARVRCRMAFEEGRFERNSRPTWETVRKSATCEAGRKNKAAKDAPVASTVVGAGTGPKVALSVGAAVDAW